MPISPQNAVHLTPCLRPISHEQRGDCLLCIRPPKKRAGECGYVVFIKLTAAPHRNRTLVSAKISPFMSMMSTWGGCGLLDPSRACSPFTLALLVSAADIYCPAIFWGALGCSLAESGISWVYLTAVESGWCVADVRMRLGWRVRGWESGEILT
jgi:hypothetical protein